MTMLPDKAGLRRDHDVLPDLAVVADVNEVVDLCSAPNARFVERAAIDRGVRSDLDVILDDQPSHLRKFFVVPVLRSRT